MRLDSFSFFFPLHAISRCCEYVAIRTSSSSFLQFTIMESLHRLLRDDLVTPLIVPGMGIFGRLLAACLTLQMLYLTGSCQNLSRPRLIHLSKLSRVRAHGDFSTSKECDATALPGSTDSQNVSARSRFVYFADQFFRFMKLMKAVFLACTTGTRESSRMPRWYCAYGLA